jgi:hypothetical protein
MAVNVTKTSHFTGGAGNPISFSQIRSEYGGSATDVKASTYLRNTNDEVDWNDETTITSRVPDATENSAVESNTNWKVDSLRDTISNYLVTQSDTNTELSYSDSNTNTWNNNLSKNIPKTFDVTGEIGADSVSDTALVFSGNLYNLDIEVDALGAIYGEGGDVGGSGGDALYVNNTYSKSDVKIRSYGKIWSGGGGGSNGSAGNKGSGLNCFNVANLNARNNACNGSGESLRGVVPTGVRSRCRGGGWRKGQGWNFTNQSGYDCGRGYIYYCRKRTNNVVGGGPAGNGGNGGEGKGFTNRGTAMNVAPHKGNSGNNGNTNNCGANGNSSTGNSGNSGNGGGDFGQGSSGNAGRAVLKKNAKVNYYNSNTLKGSIKDI